jgi:RND family efflux transporter MFP subunit
VSKVAARDVPVEVRAPVDLRAMLQADVGSKTLGVLDAVFVDRGDRVKKGQLLALVRPSDLPDQLAAARGTLAQTGASLTLARTNLERAQKLAPAGVVSQQELQNALAAVATAEAAQSAASAQAQAIAIRLGETRIDAPMEGIIAVRRLDPGAIVGLMSGGAILTVVDIKKLRVFITVTERDVHSVKIGLNAHVELDALPGKSFEGKVVRLAPIVDPSTRTLDAEVQLPNANEELRPGMFGHGAIIVDVHAHQPIVPASAVLVADAKKYVFVLTGDKVQRRAIETGVDEGNWLEVTAGLKESDEVVTAGADGLSDGSPVRVTRDVDPYSGAKLTGTPSSTSSGGSAPTARD